MTRQGADRQLLSALLAHYPIPLPFSVRVPLPRNPPPVRRLSGVSCRLAGVAHHAEFLPNICLQAHPARFIFTPEFVIASMLLLEGLVGVLIKFIELILGLLISILFIASPNRHSYHFSLPHSLLF